MVGLTHLEYFSALAIKECNIQNEEILLDEDAKLTPNIYNKISLLILRELASIIVEVSKSNKNIPINQNVPLIYFTNLLKRISSNFFIGYELSYFKELNHKNFYSKKKFSIFTKITYKKIIRDLSLNISNLMAPQNKYVGYLSNANFSWRELGALLRKKKINIFNADDNRKIFISELQFQIELIQNGIDKIYIDLIKMFKIDDNQIKKINFKDIVRNDDFITNKKIKSNKDLPEMIIAGSVGNSPRLRAYIFDYMKKNIHVSIIAHGSQHWIIDEPHYLLYEGVIADSKIIYGNIEKQKNLNIIGEKENIFGRKINYISRTDNFLSELNILDKKINTIDELKNKKVVYFGSEFTIGRYGPYRDVHPAIYSKWQSSLLSWLKEEIGGMPIVRYHPKRITEEYDPKGFEDYKNFNIEIIKNADVFVLDYPTTSLANVCSTDKPVIFFDIGLRRLKDEAKKMLKKRCYYNLVNLKDPEKSFTDIKLTFQNKCTDDFTDTFCDSGKSKSEIKIISEFINSKLQ